MSSNIQSKSKSSISVSYALAKTKTNDIFVQNSDYRTPSFVDKLPMKQPIDTGAPTTADEIPSGETFYDGTINLKTTVTFCRQYIDKAQACLHQGNCGWCYGLNKCVAGNKDGPLEPDCLRGNYLFTAPNKDWNPISNPNINTRVARSNVLGAQLTTITEQ